MARANKCSRTSINGVLVVDKPVGPSSMAVVSVVRARAGGARTGHAGTLDPLAEGVLVMVLGRATKSVDLLMATEKRYRTAIDLGAFTDTDDLEGQRREVDVPSPPNEHKVRGVLQRFLGTIMQKPPARSAVKVGGQRAYALARRGEAVELEPRPVNVYGLVVVRYEWPVVELDIRCGKGTYIRSLARDLGEALGTGGHCRTIRRTAVGPFTDSEAVKLDDVPDPLAQDDVIDLEEALARLKPQSDRS